MRFFKWHALGNSYAVVEHDEAGVMTPDRARRLCASERVSSDGVVEIVHHDDVSVAVVIWNPDGSVAEMSGNGTRIAARWLAERTGAREVLVDSGGHRVGVRLLGGVLAESTIAGVTVGHDEVIDAGEPLTITPVSVGNPHAVIRLDGATRQDLLRLGPLVETHPRFPERTNVQLAAPVDRGTLRVLVWERGAGETSSSGSSSVAAAAVAVARGWCDAPVAVHLPGGVLSVGIDGDTATLVGPAVEVGSGTADI